jgi:hypothetical protein
VSPSIASSITSNDREGGKKILGLSNAWSATYRSGKGVEISIGGKRRVRALFPFMYWQLMRSELQLPQLTDPKTRTLLAAAPTRRLLNSSAPYKYEEADGFLRLPSRRGRHEDQAYRSITQPAANSDSDSSASETENSDTDVDSDTTPLTSYQEKSKSLDSQLNADPSFVPTWLSLLSHSLSTIPITSKNASKARSEITLSIMSRALSAHPQNSSSRVLRLKYLQAGEEVWHESKLRAEWEDAWKVGGVEIWMEWLEWRIRNKDKSINRVVEDGRRVLDALGVGDDNELGKVRVFWRLAVAFQNAGVLTLHFPHFLSKQDRPQVSWNVPLPFSRPNASCAFSTSTLGVPNGVSLELSISRRQCLVCPLNPNWTLSKNSGSLKSHDWVNQMQRDGLPGQHLVGPAGSQPRRMSQRTHLRSPAYQIRIHGGLFRNLTPTEP